MATLQKIMSAFLVIALLGFAVVGCVKGNIVPPLQFSGEKFFAGKGTGFIGAVMILVYSCQGYKLTINYGGMAKNPTRDLPRSMLAVIPALIILYCGAALSDVSILPLSKVAGQPLTVAARAMFSTPVFYAFMIGAPIMALATSMNSTYGMAVGPYMQATKDGWLPGNIWQDQSSWCTCLDSDHSVGNRRYSGFNGALRRYHCKQYHGYHLSFPVSPVLLNFQTSFENAPKMGEVFHAHEQWHALSDSHHCLHCPSGHSVLFT